MKLFWFISDRVTHVDQLTYSPLIKARLTLWISLAAIAVFVFWSKQAELEQLTRAPGTVIVSSRSQLIQSQQGGVLSELLVREGDIVEAGQILARLDETDAEASFQDVAVRVASLEAIVARLNAEVFSRDLVFPESLKDYPDFKENQRALFQKRTAGLRDEVASLRRLLSLAQEELSALRPLRDRGEVADFEVTRLERELAQLESQLSTTQNDYFKQTQAELAQATEDLARARQLLTQRQNQLESRELTAPVKGVIKDLRVTTLGGVVPPGQAVMQVVPLEDDIRIEARVAPSDIAFIAKDQPVSVKLDAYDFTLYGALSGQVEYIGADTQAQGEDTAPFYIVRIKTTGRTLNNSGRELDVLPGMTAMVEMKTGTNSVWNYLAKPITKTLQESLSER